MDSYYLLCVLIDRYTTKKTALPLPKVYPGVNNYQNFLAFLITVLFHKASHLILTLTWGRYYYYYFKANRTIVTRLNYPKEYTYKGWSQDSNFCVLNFKSLYPLPPCPQKKSAQNPSAHIGSFSVWELSFIIFPQHLLGLHLVLHFKEARILGLPGPSPVYQKCHSDWRRSYPYGSCLGYLGKQRKSELKTSFQKHRGFGCVFISASRWQWIWWWCFSYVQVEVQLRLNEKYEKSQITCESFLPVCFKIS